MYKIIAKALMMTISRLTPTCEIITQKVSEGMDRRLSFIERLQVTLHLKYCKFCNLYRLQLLAIRATLQARMERKDSATEGESLSEEARDKMKQALRDEDS